MKSLLRRFIKLPVFAGGMLFHNRKPGIFFLIFHRVTGDLPLELDLPFALFKRQMEFLKATGNVIGYDEAISMLDSGIAPSRDMFVLTFDDGFRDFYTKALPLLTDLALPATLYPSTGFMETGVPNPYGTIEQGSVRPLTWDMLGEVVSSGLVTIGGHTHTHRELTGLGESEIIEELERPKELFRERLGYELKHFAYPRAIWNEDVERLVKSAYCSAVIGGGGKALSEGFDPFRIPRVPVRKSDGWFFFKAKTRGWMQDEEALYGLLKGNKY